MAEDLKGVAVLVTGATSGIGRATAEALARRGARLLVHGRSPRKLSETVEGLSRDGALVDGFAADLSSLSETARLAREVSASGVEPDVLINNAGVGFGRDQGHREESRDGHELRMAVNYLAPLLLSEDLLSAGLPRRAIVNVASVGQQPIDFDDFMTTRSYDGELAYCRSKLALIMATFDLAARHVGVVLHALHPGMFLDTAMVRECGIEPRGPASNGADATVAVVLRALGGGTSGCILTKVSPLALTSRRTTSRRSRGCVSIPSSCWRRTARAGEFAAASARAPKWKGDSSGSRGPRTSPILLHGGGSEAVHVDQRRVSNADDEKSSTRKPSGCFAEQDRGRELQPRPGPANGPGGDRRGRL